MVEISSNKMAKKAKAYALRVVEGIFDDPDFGRELTPYAKKRLREARTRRSRTKSLDETKKKYL